MLKTESSIVKHEAYQRLMMYGYGRDRSTRNGLEESCVYTWSIEARREGEEDELFCTYHHTDSIQMGPLSTF